MNEQLKQASAKWAAKNTEINTILDQIGDGGLDGEAKKSLDRLENEMVEIEQEVAAAKESEVAAKSYRDRAASRRETILAGVDNLGFAENAFRGGAGKSVGDQFATNPAFKSWVQNMAPNGSIPDGFHIGQSPALTLETGLAALKSLVTGASATSAGALVQRDYYPLVELPFRMLTIRDIVTHLTTSSDLIEYPSITGYTNAAAATAEATTTSNGTKPESSLALQKQTTSVKTIAHWIPASRRALMDAKQIRSLIDAFLVDGLEQTLETEIITGDGTGEHFLGLENVSGTTQQAFVTDIKTTVRKARTIARTTARSKPTAILMNPVDWETVDLDQDNELRYYYGGPSEMGNPRLWGLPVIESEAVTAGTAWMLDTKELLLWDREQTLIRVSDSHANFFIQNLVAILAELRAAFAVRRPAAVIEIALS